MNRSTVSLIHCLSLARREQQLIEQLIFFVMSNYIPLGHGERGLNEQKALKLYPFAKIHGNANKQNNPVSARLHTAGKCSMTSPSSTPPHEPHLGVEDALWACHYLYMWTIPRRQWWAQSDFQKSGLLALLLHCDTADCR